MTGWLTTMLVLLATAMAFLLSGMEAGVFTLSRFRIRRMARQGQRRAAQLQGYLDDTERFLWTILVGNALALFVVVTVVSLELQRWFAGRPVAFWAAVVGVLLLLYVFADLLPKLLFRRFPNRLTLWGVGPFRFISVVLTPVVWATKWVSGRLLRLTGGQAFTGRLFGTRAELRQAIEESAPALSREELTLINRILDLQSLRVRDVLTPMDRALTLPAAGTVADLLDAVRRRRVSFVPLWQETPRGRRVLGVVSVARILFDERVEAGASLSRLVEPALFVDADMRLEGTLRSMQRARQRLAVVLDSERREIGVVTLNDMLRAMFGEVSV